VNKKRTFVFDELALQNFAVCLKNKRKELGYSQEKLAYKADITLSQIARIETVKINPTLSTIFKICKALEIEPRELFEEFKLLN
jgi:predicted transcriptional regulator